MDEVIETLPAMPDENQFIFWLVIWGIKVKQALRNPVFLFSSCFLLLVAVGAILIP